MSFENSAPKISLSCFLVYFLCQFLCYFLHYFLCHFLRVPSRLLQMRVIRRGNFRSKNRPLVAERVKSDAFPLSREKP